METVSRFNELADAARRGLRPRSRPLRPCLFGGGSPLVPIDTPPFHAAAFGISDLGTKGGLRTDVDGRVLDADDRPIPGFYAAGNTMAAVSGETTRAAGTRSGRAAVQSPRGTAHGEDIATKATYFETASSSVRAWSIWSYA